MLLFRWVKAWWLRRQRQIDLEFFWPLLVASSPDIETARAAFLEHVTYDLAWTERYRYGELIKFVDALEP